MNVGGAHVRGLEVIEGVEILGASADAGELGDDEGVGEVRREITPQYGLVEPQLARDLSDDERASL